MARAKKARRTRRSAAPPPATSATVAASLLFQRVSPRDKLLLAALLVVVLASWLRWEAPLPWSYDEYYHLGLAREMSSRLRIESFWWTPFSTLYDRFVDSTPLFHLLLVPLGRLPLELAAGFGALLGQLFAVGAFAWALWTLRVPRPWWFLLALPALGTLFLQRLEMLRPHVWLIGFTVLVVALLVERRWKALAVVCALFGLTHTGGWIAVPIAALWSVSGLVTRGEGESREGARVPWQPIVAAAGGWLLGQLIHPEVPENFRLFAITNFVVPFQATGAGSAALESQLGSELFAPEGWIVAEQWPALLVAGSVVVSLLFEPRLRSRATLTAALPALAFLLVGTLRMRRFLELGEPLALLALALVVREGQRRGLAGPAAGLRKVLAALTAVAVLATVGSLRTRGFGRTSPPLAMARWLGAHGGPGERVFTAQWADSAPLFYAAPKLQSLVALDPTVFYRKDPASFERYVAVVQGRDPQPARTIRERFGARWVTLWRMPVFEALARRLFGSPGASIAYTDIDYIVVDLGKTPAGPVRPAGAAPR